MQELKLDFQITINWNKHQSKVSIQAPKLYLDFLIDPSFQRVNRLYALSSEKKDNGRVHTKYYLPTVETKDENVVIDGQNCFD